MTLQGLKAIESHRLPLWILSGASASMEGDVDNFYEWGKLQSQLSAFFFVQAFSPALKYCKCL